MFDGNVSNLLASVKRRSSIPTRQTLFKDEDFLELMSEEMQTEIVPQIIRAREDFYLIHQDFTVVSLNQQPGPGFGLDNFGLLPFGGSVPITWGQLLNRSIGTRIKDLDWLNNVGPGAKVMGHIPRITLEDLSSWGGVAGFYFEGNRIVLSPESNFIGRALRVYFYRIPNRLTLAQNCAKVQFTNFSIPGSPTITVDAIPNINWKVGFEIDIIQAYPGFESVGDSITVTNVAGNVLTVDRLSSDVNVGDWVCPSGEACVAQIPEIAYPLLAQRGSIKFLEAFGRNEEAVVADQRYEAMKDQFKNMIQPRAELAKKKIVSRKGIFTY